MSVLQELKQHFIDDGVQINPPVSVEELALFEQKYGVVLPVDLKDYFLLFNGTGQGNFGESGYAFFSLEELEPICETSDLNEEEKSIYSNCFAFSDYMIWCWGYVVRLNSVAGDNPVFSIYLSSPSDLKVANSFSEFVSIYLANPDDIIGST
jgi:hypothetical protein